MLVVLAAAVALAEVVEDEEEVVEAGVVEDETALDEATVAAVVVGPTDTTATVVGTAMEGAAEATPLNELSAPRSPPSGVVAATGLAVVTATGEAVVTGVGATMTGAVVAAGATGAAVTAPAFVPFEAWRRTILPSSTSCLRW